MGALSRVGTCLCRCGQHQCWAPSARAFLASSLAAPLGRDMQCSRQCAQTAPKVPRHRPGSSCCDSYRRCPPKSASCNLLPKHWTPTSVGGGVSGQQTAPAVLRAFQCSHSQAPRPQMGATASALRGSQQRRPCRPPLRVGLRRLVWPCTPAPPLATARACPRLGWVVLRHLLHLHSTSSRQQGRPHRPNGSPRPPPSAGQAHPAAWQAARLTPRAARAAG